MVVVAQAVNKAAPVYPGYDLFRCFISAGSAGSRHYLPSDTATTSLQSELQPVWNSPEEWHTEAKADKPKILLVNKDGSSVIVE